MNLREALKDEGEPGEETGNKPGGGSLGDVCLMTKKQPKKTPEQRQIEALVKEQRKDRRRDWLLARPRAACTKTTRHVDDE